MSGADIAVIVVVSVAFAAAVGIMIWRKLKHKGGCCDCDCCHSCSQTCDKCKKDK